MDVELLCRSCVDERQKGASIKTEVVCRECFEYATTEVAELDGVCGKPELRIREERFDVKLETMPLPLEIGPVVDIAAINLEDESVWLLLSHDGLISRFDATRGDCRPLARSSLGLEDRELWCGHNQKQRLHASPSGDFAAIVNDYGRYGQIIDLRSGQVTLSLDGDDYHAETVPFSFAFAQVNGRVIAIHRTAWNRLDVSDPSTGELLTTREPTSYERGQDRPEHYLDYFHGALHLSPDNRRIADDGWVWHPVGIPTIWDVEHWLMQNVWESEDGTSRRSLCARDYYWDHALVWLDDSRIAVGGLGDDDKEMIEGARIFDPVSDSVGGSRYESNYVREVSAFAGPSGSFFSDGRWLFSADQKGLSRWDVDDGARTGFIPQFTPSHHHRAAGELVHLVENTLVRWRMAGIDARWAGNPDLRFT